MLHLSQQQPEMPNHPEILFYKRLHVMILFGLVLAIVPTPVCVFLVRQPCGLVSVHLYQLRKQILLKMHSRPQASDFTHVLIDRLTAKTCLFSEFFYCRRFFFQGINNLFFYISFGFHSDTSSVKNRLKSSITSLI